MAKHPEVQEKIRQQVVSVLGEEGEADADSLQKMPCLNNTIKETARFGLFWCLVACCYNVYRLYHVVAATTRDLPKDTELMGYHIPAEVHTKLQF